MVLSVLSTVVVHELAKYFNDILLIQKKKIEIKGYIWGIENVK